MTTEKADRRLWVTCSRRDVPSALPLVTRNLSVEARTVNTDAMALTPTFTPISASGQLRNRID
jgi:hypothetical protein